MSTPITTSPPTNRGVNDWRVDLIAPSADSPECSVSIAQIWSTPASSPNAEVVFAGFRHTHTGVGAIVMIWEQ